MTIPISAISGARGVQSVSGAPAAAATKRFSSLFDQIDALGTGSISRSQFSRSFKSLNLPQGVQALGADTVFSALDVSGKGAVSKKEFSAGMAKLLSTLNAAKASQGHTAPSAPTSLSGVTL